jgi:hypothetical protein
MQNQWSFVFVDNEIFIQPCLGKTEIEKTLPKNGGVLFMILQNV